MLKNLRHRVWAAPYDDDQVVRNRFVMQAIPLLDAVKVLRHRASMSEAPTNTAQQGVRPEGTPGILILTVTA